MTIEEYFKEVKDKRVEMERALKRYVEATEEFYTITSVKYTDMPKAKGKVLGFDDMMVHIEDLYEFYLEQKKLYDVEYQKCMKDINKLEEALHKLIIEYAYINLEKDKQIINSLKKYHNIEISYSHLRNSKSKAKNSFTNIISTL